VPKRGLLTAIRNPAQLVVLAFTTLILSGAFLLWLPISASGSSHISADNAIFMATSAATVTGLSSLDISNFTIFGQLVILLLIQVGGFGIMTIGSVLAIVASHRLGLRQRMLAQAEIGAVDIGDLKRLIGAIARITIVVELTVGIVLFLRFWLGGYEPIGRSAYAGFYTAIAAFNNSGLTPFSDNLARFVGDPVVVFAVSFGFIIGGLGFPIMVESFRRARHRRRHGAKSRVLPWARS
jgi:trk system potassium uptake protein TrkH